MTSMLSLTCPDRVSLLTLDVVDGHLPEPGGHHPLVSDGRTGQAVLVSRLDYQRERIIRGNAQ